MKLVLRLDGRTANGGSSLCMHHERLADPLDKHTRAIQAIAKKRGKTDADHLEIGRLEFAGGMYVDDNGPCLPAWNILRCLQDGGKRHKRGADVLRGIYPLLETASLDYEGPRTIEELWKERETFSLRKTVGVQRSRTMRTRPIFSDWGTELAIEVDPTVFDRHSVEQIWHDAGLYAGIGEMRPVLGRFVATVLSDEEWLKPTNGRTPEVFWEANRSSIERILKADEQRFNDN